MFKLSATLVGHTSDIKSVSPGPNGGVITGSRDNKAIVFARDQDNHVSFSPSAVINHPNFVNAVAFIPPSSRFPQGLVLSAGRENVIYAHEPSNPSNPAYVLVGHTDNVCALAVTGTSEAPVIISGSWDNTARIWVDGVCKVTLQGHSRAVWAVLGLANGDVITGSADKTIKIWKNGSCVQTITGHADCVRGLAVLPSLGFVSCANDGSLRIWSSSGEPLQELYGHTSFVYSVDVLQSGEIISSGEDRSVRIWRDGECVQTINHPAISVWSVKALPNGDIVSGTNDGVARVFTRSEERIADAAVLKEFDTALSSFAIPKNQVGDLNTEKIPGEEALRVPGKNTGEVKVVKIGGNVEAYQWNAEDGKWEKIGDVVDAVGEGRKTMHQGKEYDYVFDVDLEDGMPPRKLPYNVSENPFTAAQNFIHREELSQTFLDQIANFIIANTKGATLGSGPVAADPYTGTGRYSGSSSQPTSFGGVGDPFTGGSAYSTQQKSPYQPMDYEPAVTPGYYPKKGYLTMDEAKLPPVVAKLLEFNPQLASDKALQLTSDEVVGLEKIAEILGQPNRFHVTSFNPVHFEIFDKLVKWPIDLRFPGLDLLRVFILHPNAAAHYSHQGLQFVEALLTAGCFGLDPNSSKAVQNNQMLALRGLVNLFRYESGQKIAQEAKSKVVDAILSCASSERPPVRIAFSTLFLNYAVLLNTSKDEDIATQITASLLELLKKENEAEVLLRSVVAVGTLLFGHPQLKDLFLTMDGKEIAQKHASSQDQKVVQAAKALLELVRK